MEVRVEDVFRALADRTRRRLLDALLERDGQSLSDLCAGSAMARQSVSKHLAVLEAAGVVSTLRRGRNTFHYLNAAPLAGIATGWIDRYRGPTEGATSYEYTALISTSPAHLWQALTEPRLTRLYWRGTEFHTDWRPGSVLVVRDTGTGIRIADPRQVVLESDPCHRLSYVCHPSIDHWYTGDMTGGNGHAPLQGGHPSKVSFDVKDLGTAVQVTVTREGLDPGGEDLRGPRRCWPIIISSLKTLLETGAALPEPRPAAALRASPTLAAGFPP